MTRTLSLVAVGLLVGGCAADFSEEQEPSAPEQTVASADDESSGTVNVFGGKLQRPAEVIGTVDEATETANARVIRNYMSRVDQAEIELGPKFNRSQTQ